MNVLQGQQTSERPHSGEESPRLIAFVSHYGMEIMGYVITHEGFVRNRRMAVVEHLMALCGH